MPADTPASPLQVAAQRRHQLTRAKAIRAIREFDNSGAPVTFEAVAQHAEVSRSWLYTQSDLRQQIQRLREATGRSPSPAIPASQRSSEESLLRRLEHANERIRHLADENQRLRRQLATALGQARARQSRPADPEIAAP
jgi:hypothetical protein